MAFWQVFVNPVVARTRPADPNHVPEGWRSEEFVTSYIVVNRLAFPTLDEAIQSIKDNYPDAERYVVDAETAEEAAARFGDQDQSRTYPVARQ